MKYAVTVLFFFFSFFVFSDNNSIDSIKTLLNQASGKENKAELLFTLGNAYFIQKDFPNALKCFKEAVDVKTNEDFEGKTYFRIGNVYDKTNQFEKALESYLKALTIAGKHSNYEMLTEVKISIGLLYMNLENFESASYYLIQAMNDGRNLPEENNLLKIQTCKYLGGIFGLLNNCDSSLYYSEIAFNLCISDSNTYQDEIGGIINNIGVCFFKLNKLEESEIFFHQALEKCLPANNPKTMSSILSNLAIISIEKKDSVAASDYFHEALEYSKNVNEPFELAMLYENLCELEKRHGKYNKALYYRELYDKEKTKIANTKLMNKISDIKNNFEVQKIENYFFVRDRERKKNMYLLLGGAILLIVLGGLIFRNMKIAVKNSQLKQKILFNEQKLLEKELKVKKTEIENFAKQIDEKNDFLESVKSKITQMEDESNYKNKELETIALTLGEKNEFLGKVSNEISKIQKSHYGSEHIKELSLLIKNNLYIDKDRDELTAKIESIQKSFLFRLEQKFPDITKAEKRLSSLLAVGLSSKEICAIMNISPDAVKKARFRLRKKLKIETSDDLSEFFKKI